MSEKRLHHYQGCLFLLLARKVLGEAAWQDCVLACDSPGAPFSGLLTWSNMDAVLFGINTSNAQGWHLHADGVLQGRGEVMDMEAKVEESSGKGSAADRNKQKLRMARSRLSMSVVFGMFYRMRSKVQDRMSAMSVK